MFAAVTALTERLMNLVALLAVCGVVVSSMSLQHHYATSKTPYCDIGEVFNCDIVNRSAYSSIFGIPVALIGMIGYGALAGLATVYRERSQTSALLLGGSAAGLLFALYLTWVEAHLLGVYCILCLSSLAVIATITILSTVIWWKMRTE